MPDHVSPLARYSSSICRSNVCGPGLTVYFSGDVETSEYVAGITINCKFGCLISESGVLGGPPQQTEGGAKQYNQR